MKSSVVSIHNSLEDVVFHQIQQDIDIDALQDGDELEAFLGDWLKRFYPKFPVSFRRVRVPVVVGGGGPHLPSSLLLLAFNSSVILLRTRKLSALTPHLCSCGSDCLWTALIPVYSANVI